MRRVASFFLEEPPAITTTMMPAIRIQDPTYLSILEDNFTTCSWCLPSFCQSVIRTVASSEECDAELRYHKSDEVLYFANSKVYIEDELLPKVMVKLINSNDTIENDATETGSGTRVLVCVALIFMMIVIVFMTKRKKPSVRHPKKQRWWFMREKQKLSRHAKVDSKMLRSLRPVCKKPQAFVIRHADIGMCLAPVAEGVKEYEDGWTRVSYKPWYSDC